MTAPIHRPVYASPDERRNQIEQMIEELRRHWLEHRNQRLGQMIVNIFGPEELFYLPDQEALYLLRNYGEMGSIS